MFEEKRGGIFYLIAISIPKQVIDSAVIILAWKEASFRVLSKRKSAGFKIGYFCYSKFIRGDPKTRRIYQDIEFTHWYICGQAGGAAGSWGAGDIGDQDSSGVWTTGPVCPIPGCSPAMAPWVAQPSGVWQYLSLGGEKTAPWSSSKRILQP